MGVKGMTHFFKAKIKKMQEDLEKQNAELKAKTEENRKLVKDNQKLTEDKEKWFRLCTSNKTQISKLEAQISTLHAKLQNCERDKQNYKKESEGFSAKAKTHALNLSNLEVKLARANEDCEKAKAALKVAKTEEKELRELHRKEVTEMSLGLKRIEKHKNELINGFKKQLQLVDNLKRQKAHLENCKVVEREEDEFLKILDWNLESD